MAGRAAALRFLEDRWDDAAAATMDGPELLRYRSNLLGSDLRLTNFGGGNTSSKLELTDPLSGAAAQVLWVKGSGGDLGSIKRSGFATLYLQKLLALEYVYKGVDLEDEMVTMYPLCTFGNNAVVASIDTPLHAFLPYPHVDHLHPDWGIALAASANGRIKMEEFNREFGHRLTWLPWQRPGFELGMMLRSAAEQTPGCDGVVLGGHGLFTWGETQRECYLNTITIIDQLGQFIARHASARFEHFGGELVRSRDDRAWIANAIMPYLRGRLSQRRRSIVSYTHSPHVMQFVNSAHAEKLAYLGTSCPDHFIRTKIRPLLIKWDPAADESALKTSVAQALELYRAEYAEYYAKHAVADSPTMRDASPIIVLIPGIGMFSFGKTKTESRIAGEFYANAIGVMQGAGSLGANSPCSEIPQAGPAASADQFSTHANYVALPPGEAFRIEYWTLEEAKIRRQPAEKELSRHIALISGVGCEAGREAALLAAQRGACVVVADRESKNAEAVARAISAVVGEEAVGWITIDPRDQTTMETAIEETVRRFGGIDILIHVAALLPAANDPALSDAQPAVKLAGEATASSLLIGAAAKVFREQDLGASVVLISSASTVAAERGSEDDKVRKEAMGSLLGELASTFAPSRVRVNGILTSPAEHALPSDESDCDAQAPGVLSPLAAIQTRARIPLDAKYCAQAALFLAGPQSCRTTGHLLPVDHDLEDLGPC